MNSAQAPVFVLKVRFTGDPLSRIYWRNMLMEKIGRFQAKIDDGGTEIKGYNLEWYQIVLSITVKAGFEITGHFEEDGISSLEQVPV